MILFVKGVVCVARVFVIGAGLTGCAAAYTLASGGASVILIDKADRIGGRVRTYGCKAVEKCQNCGVCLTAGLWDKVSNHPDIQIFTNTEIKEIRGEPGNFSVSVAYNNSVEQFDNIEAVVVSTGFDSQQDVFSAHLHIENADGFDGETGAGSLMTGSKLEEIMLERKSTGLFENAPKSVAFIQCLGSRDKNEGGLYCSRVCCSYSTRAAKMIRSYYPECKIVFFYMELQNVESGDYYAGLRELGVEFIKCRPLKIAVPCLSGTPVTVEYDDPKDGIKSKAFDLVVLSDGIHASADNDRLAEVFMLGMDADGFLQSTGTDTGIYVCGCARTPMKIDEAYTDAIAVASRILREQN